VSSVIVVGRDELCENYRVNMCECGTMRSGLEKDCSSGCVNVTNVGRAAKHFWNALWCRVVVAETSEM